MSAQRSKQDNRASQRRYVSVTEQIQVSFKLGETLVETALMNTSVGGIGVKFQTEKKLSDLELVQLKTIDLVISPSGMPPFQTKAQLVSYKLNPIDSGKSEVQFGFNFNSTESQFNDRKSKRFPIGSHLRPTFTFENQYFYYEKVFGKLLESSACFFLGEISIRNNTIFPGMPVRLCLQVPLFGEVLCDAKVLHIKINGDDSKLAKIGFKIESNLEEYQAKLAPLILTNNPESSPAELRTSGFHIETFNKVISFEYAATSEQKNEILNLRWLAWKDKDESLAKLEPHQMADEFDAKSRHLIARINGKIIASARLVYNNGEEKYCEHQSYGAQIPAWVWKKGFVETSRLVTHPDFRGGDLFLKMIHFLGRTVVQSGYSYLISSCEPSLESIYKQSGAVKLGSFTDISGKSWVLLLTDVAANCVTQGTNPITWNIFQHDEALYLFKRKFLSPTYYQYIWVYIYKQFAPLAKWLMKKKFAKRNQKK